MSNKEKPCFTRRVNKNIYRIKAMFQKRGGLPKNKAENRFLANQKQEAPNLNLMKLIISTKPLYL